MTFSGRCPLDVIFFLNVDADRAREFVPPSYKLANDDTGRAVMIVSLVACEDTGVDGVARSQAVYSDLLFQIEPPPGSGTPPVDHALDGYWAWVVTDESAVHRGLGRLGMFHGFDPDISLTATRDPIAGRVLAVDGEVRWPHSPFRLHGDVLDLTPVGIPQYGNHFWQNVPGGRMLARLTKHADGGAVGEEGRIANFTLTAPAGTPLARLLADQCQGGTDGACTVSGNGFVTQLPRFEYEISVLHAQAHRCAGKLPTKYGTPGDDTIQGTGGPDVIVGRGGNDRIAGRGGADIICGRKGNDVLIGGAGDDVLIGGDGNDVLRGGAGDDLLIGRLGSDQLAGGTGRDRCRGGRGQDAARSCEARRDIP